jgi:hypothetical protein
MAEAIDRPAGSEQQGTSAPSVGAGGAPHPVPPALPEPEVYRPLSLPALAGFSLAVVYAAVLGLSSLVALINRSPLLLPWGLFLIPLAAAGLSWVARNQIRSSEGTRSGTALASWGIGLSLVTALLYACYYAGTYFAVRQQATALAEQWMDLLRKDELARAYRLMIAPAFRPADDASLPDALGNEYNSENTPGLTWNQFRRWDFVNLFRQDSQAVQAQPLGVANWDYEKGSYLVDIRYRFKTPNLTCEVVLGLSGSKAPAGEYEGREWQIAVERTRIAQDSMKATPEGEKRFQTAMSASQFADPWTRYFALGQDLDPAWLATLPASEREAASRFLPYRQVCSFPALAGAAVLGARDRAVSRLAFDAGDLVDAKTLWVARTKTNPDAKAQMTQAMRQLFCSGPQHRMGRLSLTPTRLPLWEEKNGLLRLPLPAQVTIMNEARTGAQYTLDLKVVVEATPAGAAKRQPEWRIRSLELENGRTASQRGAPGTPGLPPRGVAPGLPEEQPPQ